MSGRKHTAKAFETEDGPRKRARTSAAADPDPDSLVRRQASGALAALQAMWEETQFMDCRLLVREREDAEPVVLRAHRAVLASSSRPFKSMVRPPARAHRYAPTALRPTFIMTTGFPRQSLQPAAPRWAFS